MAFDVIYMEGMDSIGSGDTRAETRFQFSFQSASVGTDISAIGPFQGDIVMHFNQGSLQQDQYLYHSVEASGHTTAFLSFWMWLEGGFTENWRLFEGQWAGGLEHVTVVVDSDNQGLTVRRGDTSGTIIGTGFIQIPYTDWSHVETKVVVAASTGSVEVRINGNTVVNLTNVNTLNSTGVKGEINGFLVQGNGNATDEFAVGDVVLQGKNGDWLGRHRIRSYMPNADGAVTTFTPLSGSTNYLMVDETTFDGETTYVSGSTSAQRDRLAFENPAFEQEAAAVGVKVIAERMTVGYVALKVGIRGEAGTEDLSTAGVVPRLTTRYNPIQHIIHTNPEDGLAWEATDLDGAELVYEIE